ncbi:MAG: DUF423 domain-containing protein [Fulvivirga sp.]|nr:DUF423 domain-containing protein [Fulvivirga sp.]
MNNLSKKFLLISGISGALAVGLGAFGAHAFKPMLIAADRLATYETAVLYHFIHTQALFGLAIILNIHQKTGFKYAGIAFTTGIVIFSGSLYVLCFSGISWLGAITPIGGILFIIGWLLVAFSIIGKSNGLDQPSES